jgi:hypothetical protein
MSEDSAWTPPSTVEEGHRLRLELVEKLQYGSVGSGPSATP